MSKTLTEIAQIISKIEDDLYDKADEMIALHRGFRLNQERIRELKSINADLYEALEDAAALIENMVSDLDFEFLSYYSEHRAVIKQNKAALAKARGKEQKR